MRTRRPQKRVEDFLPPALYLSIPCEWYYFQCIIFIFLLIKDLEKQEELKIVHMYLKEHQETIDELRGIVSEKTNEISNMQKDLENSNAALKAQVFFFF